MADTPTPPIIVTPSGASKPPPETNRTAAPAPPGARLEHRALGVFALVSCIAIVWLAAPLGIGILLGALTAFTLQPLHRRLLVRWHNHPGLAALACVGIATVVVVGTISVLGYLIIVRGVALAQQLVQTLEHVGTHHAGPPALTRLLAHVHLTVPIITARIGAVATSAISRLTSLATSIASATFHALILLFFMAISTHFTLRHWSDVVRHIQLLLPLDPQHSRLLLDEFRRVGKNVLLGTVLTGLAQGGLAFLGYLVARVPDPAFFGAATAVASLLPAVGTLIVWAPLGVFLIVAGHTAHGVIVLAWGALAVIGLSDYVIRPKLAGGNDSNPTLVTFVAIFGGLEVFGLSGLILGPVIMALALAMLRLYESQRPVEVGLVTPEPAGPSVPIARRPESES